VAHDISVCEKQGESKPIITISLFITTLKFVIIPQHSANRERKGGNVYTSCFVNAVVFYILLYEI